MGTGEFNAGGNPAMDWHPIQGGVEIFLVASCHGNRDKLRPGGPLGSYADLRTFKRYTVWLFQNNTWILMSFDLNISFDKANVSEGSLDYLLDCFLRSTFTLMSPLACTPMIEVMELS